MVVLLGQVETEVLGREAFQEVDLPGFYREITKWGTTLHRADRAAEVAAEAMRQATYGRPGPAVVALPADVLGQPAGEPRTGPPAPPPRPAPSADDVDLIVTALRGARRPVMIVGGGVLRSGARVRELAERVGLGVYTAFRRQDAFPASHPNYLGHLGLGTPADLLEPLRNADCVLALGTRLSEVTTQGYRFPAPGQRLFVCDIDPAAPGSHRGLERAVVADAGLLANALVTALPEGSPRDWSAAHAAYLGHSEPRPQPCDAGVHPDAVVAAMRRHLDADTVLTNDAGNFSAFCHSRWRFEHPGTQLGPTSGAMGYGVPAAVGAALAAPDRRVVGLAGDGGFLMTGQELETAVRVGARVLVVVFQNGLYGTIAMHQARATGRPAGVDIGPVDLAAYARALGAGGGTAAADDQLDDAFAAALAADGPYVLAVRTDPDVISPGARLSAMLPEGGRP